jgi:TRAP-type C4-dicarboxylate transport system permease small subunit
MRYLVGNSLSWPEEVSRYSFIWLSYLGLSYAIKKDASLKVDIIHTLVPKLKAPLNVFGDIVLFLFCIAMIQPGYHTILKTMAIGSNSAAISMPMWILYVSLFLGVILSCIRLIQKYTLKIISYKKCKSEGQIPSGRPDKEV